MKKLLKISIFIYFSFALNIAFAQRGHHQKNGHHGRPNKVVVVKRSKYRPHKARIFHPHWGPNYAYRNRWIFFPKYNLYWDNWRNEYVYINNGLWISRPVAPPIILNINLDKEEQNELDSNNDDIDDVYHYNNQH